MRELHLLDESFAVARLDPDASAPDWAIGELVSVTRTRDELSIACAEASVPGDVRAERGFRCFRVAGPIAFTETGVLESLLRPLADAQISIFALSTFDTDYVLVPGEDVARAADTLRLAGCDVHAAGVV